VPPLGNLAGERCLHQSFAKGFASDAGAVPPSSDLGGELAVETTRDLIWSSEQSSLQTRYQSRYRDNT